MNASFEWSPLLPMPAIALLAVAALLVFVFAAWRRAPDFYARGFFLALLAALLLNPVIIREVREPLPDKLLIVVDDSASENIAQRSVVAAKALDHIKEELKAFPNTEPVIIRGGQDAASLKAQNTSLFAALRENLASVPLGQVAGTIFITDGQVHDVPEDIKPWEKLGPFHVVLTGKKNEFDRKVTVVEAPKYGLLSQDVTVKVKVDDVGRAAGETVMLAVRQDGKQLAQQTVTTGGETNFTFTLDHPGQNVFEFSVPAEKEELTAANNTAAVIVNGVRDRLKVLLVSGSPHIGERAWRDLLKSDPSIDLVHFTILRSPSSFDSTPPREMSLIAFPVQELFEKKIRDFDLIIFDKYAQYGLLQPQYFSNIAAYVKGGGAFFIAMGSDKPEQTLFDTAVGDILPITPKPAEDSILRGAYRPQLTEKGKLHPVTGDFATIEKWGSWLTQVDVNAVRGETLMTGKDGKPLLILDKVGDGRVGVLASDNIWMWSRGLDGGGPYTELLRHVAHWLMKEPELEDDFIRADARGSTITVAERSASSVAKTVTLTCPDGNDETVPLAASTGKDQGKGWLSAKIEASQNGIYRFSNGTKSAYAVVGTAASAEFADVHTTDEKLKPAVEKTGGQILWYDEQPGFSLRPVSPHQGHFGGADWLGLRQKNAYAVKNVESAPLLDNWLLLLIIIGFLFGSWWRESRQKGVKKAPRV